MLVIDTLSQLSSRQQIQGILPPTHGVTPKFQHPVSHGHYCATAAVVCVVLAALFVSARLYV